MEISKKQARWTAQKAVLAGRLIVPDACESCGKQPADGRALHKHHEDHQCPTTVLWLCHRCHNQRHSGRIPIYELTRSGLIISQDGMEEAARRRLLTQLRAELRFWCGVRRVWALALREAGWTYQGIAGAFRLKSREHARQLVERQRQIRGDMEG
jgi:hypothetical protein